MSHRLASTVFDDPLSSNTNTSSSKRPRMDDRFLHPRKKPLLSRADSTASLPSPPPTIDVRSSSSGPRTFVSSPVSSPAGEMDVDATEPKAKEQGQAGAPGMQRQLSNPFFFLAPSAAALARSQHPQPAAASTSSRHLFAAAALHGSPTSGAARRRATRCRADKDRIALEGRRLDESSDEEMAEDEPEEEGGQQEDVMGRQDPGNVFLCGPGEVRRGKKLAEVEERLLGGRRPGIAMTYVFRGKRITYDTIPPELATESPFQPKFLFPTASPPRSRSSSPSPTPLRMPELKRAQGPPATPGEAICVNGMPTPAKTAERKGRKIGLGQTMGQARTQVPLARIR